MALPKDKKDKGDPPKEDDNKNNKKNLPWFCGRCDIYYGWIDRDKHRYCYRVTPLTPESGLMLRKTKTMIKGYKISII